MQKDKTTLPGKRGLFADDLSDVVDVKWCGRVVPEVSG